MVPNVPVADFIEPTQLMSGGLLRFLSEAANDGNLAG